MNAHIKAEIKNAQPLIGAQILDLIQSDTGYWGFRICTKHGKRISVWVDCDPEGNGPGHLHLEQEYEKS